MSKTIEVITRITIPDGKEWIANKAEEKLGWFDEMDMEHQYPEDKDKTQFRKNLADTLSNQVVRAVEDSILEHYGQSEYEEAQATIQSLEIEKSFSIS